MAAVTFSEKDTRFLRYVRVGRLATRDGDNVHLVPMCPWDYALGEIQEPH